MAQKNFLDVVINIIGIGTKTVQIEKGCSFENNGKIYRVNNDCKLAIWDKAKKEWAAGNEITMRSYQFDTFEAVANNDKKAGLSKEDINMAIDMQKNGILGEDLQKTLKNGYKAEKPQRYTNNNAISAYITNGNKSTSANLIFKYGEADDAIRISDYVNRKTAKDTKPQTEQSTKNQAPQNTKHAQKQNNTNKAKQPAQVSKKRTIQITKKKSKAYARNNPIEVKKLKPGKEAVNLIKSRELFVPYAYDDAGKTYYDKDRKRYMPVPFKKGMKLNGTLTIGYGHTGKDVKPGQTISEQKAEKILRKDMTHAVKAIRENVKVKLTQNEFDALVSFTFNSGGEAFGKSTMCKLINEGKFAEASDEFPKWNKTTINKKKVISRGLVERRKEERALFRKA